MEILDGSLCISSNSFKCVQMSTSSSKLSGSSVRQRADGPSLVLFCAHHCFLCASVNTFHQKYGLTEVGPEDSESSVNAPPRGLAIRPPCAFTGYNRPDASRRHQLPSAHPTNTPGSSIRIILRGLCPRQGTRACGAGSELDPDLLALASAIPLS